jgi:hypothetical protein
MKKWKYALTVLLAILIALAVAIGAILAFCQYRYAESKNEYLRFQDSVLGKTSAEVEELYGEFDNSGMRRGEDGLFRSTRCSYIVIPERVGFLGTTPPWVISVSFDADGIAQSVCFEQGGFGG